MSILSDNITYYRKKRGYTQKQLSDLINVSPSFISHIENGNSQPAVKTLKKIAEVLDVSVYELNVPISSKSELDTKEDLELIELLLKLTKNNHVTWNIHKKCDSGKFEGMISFKTVIKGLQYILSYDRGSLVNDRICMLNVLDESNKELICIAEGVPFTKTYKLLNDLSNEIDSTQKDNSVVYKIINSLEDYYDSQKKENHENKED